MLDHCVTVLGFEDDGIFIGDPLNGLNRLSLQEFEDQWEFVGIVLNRIPAGRGK